LGALYCNVECQRKDWTAHKKQCTEAFVTRKGLEFSDGIRSLVELDATLARQRRLAEAGDACQQFNVAIAYDRGLGVGVDKKMAVFWYKKSALAGYAPAQHSLAFAYCNAGEGVAVDKVEAEKWFKKSADKNYVESMFTLANNNPNTFIYLSDRSQAMNWLKKAAARGHSQAQCDLGYAYSSGKGIAVDYEQSVKWYKLSSASGCAQAMCNLGNAYAEGRGVPVNDKEAVKYWKMAVSLENEVGQYSLGKAYFFGQQGLTEDTVEGIRLIKLASKNGFEEATDFLSKADGIQKCLLDVIDVLNRPRPSK